MTTPPTPAEIEAAEDLYRHFQMSFRNDEYERIQHEVFIREVSAIIAAHRPPADSALRDACQKLIAYRYRNTLNFQLEKADDFINQMRTLLESEPADPAQAHVAELEAELKTVIWAFRNYGKPSLYDAINHADTLLATLERERNETPAATRD